MKRHTKSQFDWRKLLRPEVNRQPRKWEKTEPVHIKKVVSEYMADVEKRIARNVRSK